MNFLKNTRETDKDFYEKIKSHRQTPVTETKSKLISSGIILNNLKSSLLVSFLKDVVNRFKRIIVFLMICVLMMYASNAGKSGGSFITAAAVSKLLSRLGTVIKTEINKGYEISA